MPGVPEAGERCGVKYLAVTTERGLDTIEHAFQGDKDGEGLRTVCGRAIPDRDVFMMNERKIQGGTRTTASGSTVWRTHAEEFEVADPDAGGKHYLCARCRASVWKRCGGAA